MATVRLQRMPPKAEAPAVFGISFPQVNARQLGFGLGLTVVGAGLVMAPGGMTTKAIGGVGVLGGMALAVTAFRSKGGLVTPITDTPQPELEVSTG